MHDVDVEGVGRISFDDDVTVDEIKAYLDNQFSGKSQMNHQQLNKNNIRSEQGKSAMSYLSQIIRGEIAENGIGNIAKILNESVDNPAGMLELFGAGSISKVIKSPVNSLIKETLESDLVNMGASPKRIKEFMESKSFFDDAFMEGEKAAAKQKREGGDIYNYAPDWIYGNGTNPIDNAGLRSEAFDLGVKGIYPDTVKSKRIGNIPERGFSTNFRDDTYESGTSVLGIYDRSGGFENINDKTFRLFNDGDEVDLFGLLHPEKTGSDSERLLLSPVLLND